MFVTEKLVESVKANKLKLASNNLEDKLIDNFFKEFMYDKDKLLLELAFSKETTQEDIDKFLEKWDIEAVGGHKALMLAYFMKLHPDLKFSDYVKPRLEGLLKYYRFHNLKVISHFTKIGRAFNEAGIPVMIIKGGAIKYIRQELPRVMGDIDILVPWNDFKRTIQIAKDLGYDVNIANHSIDLHPPGTETGTVDIHRYVDMSTGYESQINADIFNRALKAKAFGVDVLVPSYEDIVFLALINLAKNLRYNTSTPGLLYNLFDCDYLVSHKKDFDWNIVINNAKKTKTQVQLSFAVTFINKIVPGLLPEFLKSIFAKEVLEYSRFIMFERFFFLDMQTKCRPIKLKESIKSLEKMKEYMRLKPGYFILKQLKKHPFFVKKFYDIIIKIYGFKEERA